MSKPKSKRQPMTASAKAELLARLAKGRKKSAAKKPAGKKPVAKKAKGRKPSGKAALKVNGIAFHFGQKYEKPLKYRVVALNTVVVVTQE
jgi:hypothetical protein